MAVVARLTLVPAQKLVIGVYIVIEGRLFPCNADMTGVALDAAMFVVCVILLVAGDAGLVHFILERIFRVTISAGSLRVFSVEPEVRIPGMVKT